MNTTCKTVKINGQLRKSLDTGPRHNMSSFVELILCLGPVSRLFINCPIYLNSLTSSIHLRFIDKETDLEGV